MDLNKIGRFIFKLRNEKSLSQRQLAEMFPVTRQAVSSWENGKSLPDSQILVKLSEIFGVTIDDILAGEILTSDNKNETTEINLSLVDEYNSKKKTIKRITMISVVTITTIILFFLGYYFINSYNSIKVYKIKGENENFKTYNGIMVSTRQKNYIRIGELIDRKSDKKIKSLKLYFLDSNNKERILYEDDKTDILIISRYGYDKNFVGDDLNYLIKKLFLEIRYNDEEKDKIKLIVEKDFANNFKFDDNLDSIADTEETSEDNNPIIYEKVKSKMEEKGIKVNDSYFLSLNENEDKIEFELNENKLSIIVNNDKKNEKWICTFDYNLFIRYTILESNENDENKYLLVVNNNTKLKNKEKEIYNKMVKYITNYILN